MAGGTQEQPLGAPCAPAGHTALAGMALAGCGGLVALVLVVTSEMKAGENYS